MKKNRKSITEKKIEKYENSKRISMIKALVLIVFAIILILTNIFSQEMSINSGIINESLLSINKYIHLFFGNMYFLFIISLIILAIVNISLIKLKFLNVLNYCIFFTLLSSALTVLGISTMNENNIFDAGQNILSYGFLGKGAGIYGAIVSIPMYKFIGKTWYVASLFILSIGFFYISFKNTIKNIYIAISSWIKYLDSEEYKSKKEIIRVKKEFEKENQMKIDKDIESRFKNIIIEKTKENINKKIYEKPKNSFLSKPEYYTEEEMQVQQKIWDEYIKSQNKIREQLDKEKLNSKETPIEPIQVQEDIIQDEEVKPEETKVEVEDIVEEKITPITQTIVPKPNIDPRLEGELKSSIDDIFTYKQVNEEEKEKLKLEISENIESLEEVLRDYGVEAKVVDYVTGPTITRYEITIPSGVRVNKVTQLSDEISMKLKAKSVRFEAPIPGKGTIGIETPNNTKEMVHFSNLIHNKELDTGELKVILGKDIVGRDKIIDIAKMPHLLIAGQTGSGKSVAINTIISSLISKKTKDEVKFILVDPKMVELMPYNNIPHLLVPVIINPEQAAIALKWAVVEMEARYEKLAKTGVRNIKTYNQYANEKMPYIVVIIDELADLMMVSANTVEISIARIAQKARAVGIHLIVATQRPSTDVITGMIKANLPSRISFAVRSQIDSRTILDQVGAEKLLGMGDMFILENGSSVLERVQGAYISDDEVTKLTTVLKERYSAEYNMDILEDKDLVEDNQDPLYNQALELINSMGDDKISISRIQRDLKVGFNRASRICEELKNNGIIDENNQRINY